MESTDLRFEKITIENLEIAVQIQNCIFPHENGKRNFIESINETSGEDDIICCYWLVKKQNTYIGVVGLYSYPQYPQDVWLGWFGLLSTYQGMGYGSLVFQFVENEAQKKGYKHLRLYTDSVDNQDAVGFYRKLGMLSEVYARSDDVFAQIGQTLIFSKSIDGLPVSAWGNKNLWLSKQEKKQNMY